MRSAWLVLTLAPVLVVKSPSRLPPCGGSASMRTVFARMDGTRFTTIELFFGMGVFSPWYSSPVSLEWSRNRQTQQRQQGQSAFTFARLRPASVSVCALTHW